MKLWIDNIVNHKKHVFRAGMICLMAGSLLFATGGVAAEPNIQPPPHEPTTHGSIPQNEKQADVLPVLSDDVLSCSTSSCLSSALKNVTPGKRIVLAPGTYTGSFSSDVDGTETAPITIQSQDPANPAVLSGYSTGSGFSLRVRGDHWIIRDMIFTNAQKGILLDHSNHTLITDVEVYNIGYEAVHFRDGTSYSTIENSYIHDTGKTGPGFGEGVYVGSANGASYDPNTHYNTIRSVVFGPNITAEHIDIKERSIGTLVEYCTFYGEGISGANYADSFIDVKGNDAIIRHNIGYQQGNSIIVDAFQLHEILPGWGINNTFSNNTLYLTDPAVYVIGAYSSTSATATQNTRSPAGNMYKGNVTVQ
ncbi:right-handed parallel beta-helix repeat-containing protein [Paenibacillus sp. 1001270B_150601_E10]|uniref:right-handed parallel beta-helix repeat-containing protein n=1 Tax=Paenibacillus sp. 1001270B_150601_E10 TaxID=2787079 RepID=UPI001E38EDAD|nr:right-handed parallel beta-helix repeat-containing protein [Paenibacillus sp. 1001270B_150601_E10]